ncbi:CDP-alcohol phosphatidyltransferase family protein [Paracoccus beibuensis]|uniref:CDP-alcohol phosphatidyltransferase family protein n=1 Tax=Paracoccus beibuensis TaxID=547602 RepID=UPI00223FFFB3|nr:CDP-alcohol phosphatidyltransferase family protein [Paracoccus beibuensis]
MQVAGSDKIVADARVAGHVPGRLPDGLLLAVPAGLALNLGVGVLVTGQGTGALVAATAYGAAAMIVLIGMRRHYPHARIGTCNTVTLMRTALTAALLAPLVGGTAAGWTIAAVATLALAMDGLDGFLARRSGLVSAFGARFDMEVDAALALILALHVLTGTAVGLEVLILGVMRYVFVTGAAMMRWLRRPLPVSMRRKTVCVIQLAALIALQVPQMPADLAIWLARAASAALAWSFASDVVWLWRRR